MKAIVLLSGGQDSTTCLYWAKKRFEYVEAIGFDYGQKHKIELVQAQKIASDAGVLFSIIDLKGIFGGSSLLNDNINHQENHAINQNLPASFVAGRNMLFITIAASVAHGKGIENIVTGVCETDYSGYPDCRKEFIASVTESVNLAMDANFKIYTPLMFLTKAETWKLAKDIGCLDVIINDTITDYNGSTVFNEWGYGVEDNPATILRVKGYKEAKKKRWI